MLYLSIMGNMNIKFGTSGWRAVIADDFNANTVRRVAHAAAEHVKQHPDYGIKGEEYLVNLQNKGLRPPSNPHLTITYDTRYMSEDFARTAAEAITADNITVSISKEEAPVGALAWQVAKTNSLGGLMIAAGNSPSYISGVKWLPFWGGPALDEIAADLESRISSLTIAKTDKRTDYAEGVETGLIKEEDFFTDYRKQIESLIDIETVRKAKLKVASDPLYGAGRKYLRPLLETAGAQVISLHEERDVLFGGQEPGTGIANLAELKDVVIKNRLDLGLACNCDGDRFGILDSEGKWISPNVILGLILEHLVKNKGMTGKAARSVMTSHFMDAVAKNYGVEVRQTKVGFKHIGNLMRSGLYLLGGEESSGLTIKNHTAERDGILTCLLIAELVAYNKKPLKKIIEEAEKKYGKFITTRSFLPLPGFMQMETLIEKLQNYPPLSLADKSVWRIDNTDGFKFIMKDGSWLGLRPSGTNAEPVMRLYTEAKTPEFSRKLNEAGKKIVNGKF